MSNPEMEQHCSELRHDLKVWEKKFASQHDGRKAAREDIKADATISRKYKEYNKLRDILAGRTAPQSPARQAPSRKATLDTDRTPKANQKHLTSTPLKRKREDSAHNEENADNDLELFSPQGPAMIGPTPQRDGIVLGLFDLLPAETPSKKRGVLADMAPNILQTPSKKVGKAESETSLESRARGERTPQSSGKRFLLDRFVTPKKRKLSEEGTPTSTSKGLSTPAFLRRSNVLNAIEEADEPTPRPAPWKRRPFGRSLSNMIQSMRNQEEERLDEEADIMRELEMENDNPLVLKTSKAPTLLVEDSQVAMPLGPDRGLESEDLDETEGDDGLGPNGKARKIWKKRGQKRQTRRVIMKPNFTKPKPMPPQVLDEGSEECEAAETQPSLDTAACKPELSDPDDSGSEYASDDSHTPKKRKAQPKKSEDAPASKVKDDKANSTGPVKTAARKVKATAHANYRKLKIKSSKGAKGGKGRFGGRRR